MRLIVDGIVYGRQTHGGINTYYNEILPRLANRYGIGVNLLLPRVCLGTTPPLPVRALPRDFIPNETGISWKLDQLLKTVNLHTIGFWGRTKPKTIFQSTYFTWLPGWIPHVAIAHDMNHELFPERYNNDFGVWLRKIYPEYLRRADRIISVSHTTKKHIIRFYNIDDSRIDVVHHATDPGTFFMDRDDRHLRLLHDRFGITPPYILYVGGRSIAYKNFPRLLDAFARVVQGSGLTLVVAGANWTAAESSQAHTLSIEDSVRLVEDPNDDLLRILYNCAHAFVYPSYAEGFGIPLLEAMACGTPVLASSTPVFHEVAGDAPVFFDPNDTADLVKAVETSFDKRTRQECISRGLAQVAQFSWDKSAADTYSVYQKTLG
jgi:glycosyltransferase involved in cell wall biosynthesis